MADEQIVEQTYEYPVREYQPQYFTPAALHLMPVGLTLAVNPGESYATVLRRFNAFRAPDRQITALWTQDGRPVLLESNITNYTVVWLQRPG
ncbi:hypothetical protein EBZ80_16090 [bacterium]|nr:hypothetical protein [bacterium]